MQLASELFALQGFCVGGYIDGAGIGPVHMQALGGIDRQLEFDELVVFIEGQGNLLTWLESSAGFFECLVFAEGGKLALRHMLAVEYFGKAVTFAQCGLLPGGRRCCFGRVGCWGERCACRLG